MKSAFLLHGTGGNDEDYFWFGDTKKYLEQHGYNVWWPQLPNTDAPEFLETRNFIENNMPIFNKHTIMIGHSSSCPMILTLLQYFRVKIKQAILVAGYYQPIKDQATSLLQDEEFDWGAIQQKAAEIVMFNSDNDPWGCDDKQARPAAQKLNAKFFLMKGQGHMGSLKFNQPYREFPELKEILNV